jgi:hypothetical protein
VKPTPPPAAARPGPAGGTPPHELTPEQAVQRQAIAMMDDLAGVRTAMAMLAAEGQGPAARATSRHEHSGAAQEDPSSALSADPAPLTGGATSGAAGSAPSGGGGGSGAVYALLIALAALAGGIWARLQIIPVRWRSVTIVALNERPG